MQLWDLCPGMAATVDRVTDTGRMGRRLMDLGLVPGTEVACLGENPGGSLKAFDIRGAVIALRRRDGASVNLKERRDCPWA